jgi:hypothetical protein
VVWLVGWSIAAMVILPVAATVGVARAAYRLYQWVCDLPAVIAARDRRKARLLYQRACALHSTTPAPSPEEFAQEVGRRLNELGCGSEVYDSLLPTVRALYEAEGFCAAPPPPTNTNALDAARYRDSASAWVSKVSYPGAIDLACDTIVQAMIGLLQFLPPGSWQRSSEPASSPEKASPASFSVRLTDLLRDVPLAVEATMQPFRSQKVILAGLFASLRSRIDQNQIRMSSGTRPTSGVQPPLVAPTEYRGTNDEIVRGYLIETVLEELFRAEVPFELPSAARFEHHWILAGSGHGKSQTLQYLAANDLEKVAKGQASVVVIDSQGDLIRNIAGLKLFAEGQPLFGRLCLIDPTDIEFPVALNLFDASIDRINKYSPLDRERLMNGVLELYDFVLGSLLSAELTQKQSIIFRYITRLMLHIPGATIHTFRELMEPKGYDRYLPYIAKLEGTARAFFETEFNSKQFEDTKRQVVRRLWGILENQTFERMFSHPKNKLDLFSEMNAGKVILINTAKDLLKQNGSEIFGRFFIALIAQVAQERATLPKRARMPTYVYIDECAEYLDHNVSLIIETARKQNIGMVLAHQYLGQMSPKLQESMSTNTSIKFAGGVSDKDARALSNMLRCTPEFVFDQPKGHFAVSVRNMTGAAVSLRIPFGHLEAMPRMTNEEFSVIRNAMRERYAVHWKEVGQHTAANEPVSTSSSAEMYVDQTAAQEW